MSAFACAADKSTSFLVERKKRRREGEGGKPYDEQSSAYSCTTVILIMLIRHRTMWRIKEKCSMNRKFVGF
jgi:hypothetical protein